jgi:hypothetical protein
MFKPVLSVLSIILIVFIFSLVSSGEVSFSEYFPAFLLIISLMVIPCTYLFIEYFIATRNQIVEITSEFISIKCNGSKPTYYLITELEVIKLYKSKGAEKGNFVVATHQMFYHAEIFTKSGDRLVLTSFLGPHFDEALDLLKNIRKEVKRSVFSTICLKLF